LAGGTNQQDAAPPQAAGSNLLAALAGGTSQQTRRVKISRPRSKAREAIGLNSADEEVGEPSQSAALQQVIGTNAQYEELDFIGDLEL
jgi:hypothetical protein